MATLSDLKNTELQKIRYPASINFKKTNSNILFESADELKKFLTKEHEFWSEFKEKNPPDPSFLYTTYVEMINLSSVNLNKFSDGEFPFSNESVDEKYIPISAGGGLLLYSALCTLPRVAAIAAHFLIKPENTLWNTNLNAEIISAISIITSIKSSPDTRILDGFSLTEKIESSYMQHEKNKKEFMDLIENTRLKSEDLLEALKTKLTLEAPITFWKNRAHYSRIEKNKFTKLWKINICLFGFIFVIISIFLFSNLSRDIIPVSMDPQNWIVGIAPRALLLGTISALWVWFLKYQLRSVRTYEHLTEDAEERVTMIETLTALQAFGIGQDSLSPILTSLYRPAVSSLNEDSGPTLPSELVLKILDFQKK